MESLKLLITNLNNYSSNLNKLAVLQQVTDTSVKSLLEIIYNPDKPFHITSTHVRKYTPKTTGKSVDTLQDLLVLLNTRVVTGHEALEVVHIFMSHHTEYIDLILNAIDKDLKISVNVKTLNKAIPGLINVFPGIALGVAYTPGLVKDTNWLISRKLDGVRCITIISSVTDIRFYSRQGKEFFVLDKLKQSIAKHYIKPMVLDGEIAVVSPDTGIEDFQSIMKMIRKKDYTIEDPRYYLFDVLSIPDFYKGTSSTILSERLKLYNMKCPLINVIEQVPYSQLNHMNERVTNEHWEGLILRKNSVYQGKRSNDILKVKQFHTEEYTVVDTENGTIRHHNGSNYTDLECMTAVFIENKGVPVKVGSGFSHTERIEFFKYPERIIGKIIAVQFFEETIDFSLRFPTFKGIYGVSRDI